MGIDWRVDSQRRFHRHLSKTAFERAGRDGPVQDLELSTDSFGASRLFRTLPTSLTDSPACATLNAINRRKECGQLFRVDRRIPYDRFDVDIAEFQQVHEPGKVIRVRMRDTNKSKLPDVMFAKPLQGPVGRGGSHVVTAAVH